MGILASGAKEISHEQYGGAGVEVVAVDTPALGDRSYLAHDGRVAVVVDPSGTSTGCWTWPLNRYLGGRR